MDGERTRDGARADETSPESTGGDGLSTAPGATGLGTRLGRYQLISLVGSGGMGAVFSARDPELDRTVAVKVLHATHDAATVIGELRMRREGQTMARLAHPNVIRVYDVGVAGDRVFVAMEYVSGGTLAEWLERAPRTPAEIIATFVQAGRGLAAAHDAGLVHRDFKPSNVMVADDGRVLVTDFGLARPSDASPEPEPGAGSSPASSLATITRAGAAVGTPAFMAPEQHAGASVDARADQFSFCVSLWRALYGTAPYAGSSSQELRASMSRGGPDAPPEKAAAKVPPRVRAALERGLRAAPADRFPSMRVLLGALAPPPPPFRAWVPFALAGAVAIAGTGAWIVARSGASSGGGDSCEAHIDRFAGVWDDGAARAVHDAFVATQAPYADASFREVSRQLDLHRDAWQAMRRDNCMATRARHQQSDAMMDLRAACLDQRFGDLAAFVGELRRADADTVKTAAQQAAAVGDVASCADSDALARRAPLPADAARRTAIAAFERDLAALRAKVAAGHARDVVGGTDALIARAKAIGYQPAIGEAFELAGDAQQGSDRSADAERSYLEGELAGEAGGDDALRFDCEVRLVRIVGYNLERDADGERHAERAAALLTRLGADPRRAATLARSRSYTDWWNGRYPVARRRAQEAVDLLAKIDPDGVELASALHIRAIIEQEMGDNEASVATEKDSIRIDERALGAGHPYVALDYETLGGSLRNLQRLADAHAALAHGLELTLATDGPESESASNAMSNLANLEIDEKKYDDAVELHRRSLAIIEKVKGPDHSRVADILDALAHALREDGRRDEAEAAYLRSIEIHVERLGPDAPPTALTRRHLAELYLEENQPARARPLLLESIRAIEASQGVDSHMLARPLASLAAADLALGDRAAAIAGYEHALALTGADAHDAQFRADTEAALAKLAKH